MELALWPVPFCLSCVLSSDFVAADGLGVYWWDIPGSDHLARLVFQGGFGFVRAGIKDMDAGIANTYGSFLIPLGVGID